MISALPLCSPRRRSNCTMASAASPPRPSATARWVRDCQRSAYNRWPAQTAAAFLELAHFQQQIAEVGPAERQSAVHLVALRAKSTAVWRSACLQKRSAYVSRYKASVGDSVARRRRSLAAAGFPSRCAISPRRCSAPAAPGEASRISRHDSRAASKSPREKLRRADLRSAATEDTPGILAWSAAGCTGSGRSGAAPSALQYRSQRRRRLHSERHQFGATLVPQ